MRLLWSACLILCAFTTNTTAAMLSIKSPPAVRIEALSTQASCFKKLERALEKNQGNCGNSGCSMHVRHCWSNGEQTVRRNAELLLEAAEKRYQLEAITNADKARTDTCYQTLNELSGNATNDFDKATEEFLKTIPIDVQGTARIQHRLLSYELMYTTYSQKQCRPQSARRLAL